MASDFWAPANIFYWLVETPDWWRLQWSTVTQCNMPKPRHA